MKFYEYTLPIMRADMLNVGYITSSSFSGSTLVSFLLNMHPKISTVGEMDGWNYGEDEVFLCSCGKTLDTCPMFQHIASSFKKNHLKFDCKDFGTKYSLSNNESLNRYLTQDCKLNSSLVEKLRDRVISSIPPYGNKLKAIDLANKVFMESSLQYGNSDIFVDACKDPYRIRLLSRIKEIDLKIIYLVRDFRGVVFSNIKNKKRPVAIAMRLWLREQTVINRIISEFPFVMMVKYEDICRDPTSKLKELHSFLRVEAYHNEGSFRSVENHIIGNSMRLSSMDKIILSTQWKEKLSKNDLSQIEKMGVEFIERKKDSPVAKLLQYYFDHE